MRATSWGFKSPLAHQLVLRQAKFPRGSTRTPSMSGPDLALFATAASEGTFWEGAGAVAAQFL